MCVHRFHHLSSPLQAGICNLGPAALPSTDFNEGHSIESHSRYCFLHYEGCWMARRRLTKVLEYVQGAGELSVDRRLACWWQLVEESCQNTALGQRKLEKLNLPQQKIQLNLISFSCMQWHFWQQEWVCFLIQTCLFPNKNFFLTHSSRHTPCPI